MSRLESELGTTETVEFDAEEETTMSEPRITLDGHNNVRSMIPFPKRIIHADTIDSQTVDKLERKLSELKLEIRAADYGYYDSSDDNDTISESDEAAEIETGAGLPTALSSAYDVRTIIGLMSFSPR